MSFKVLKNMYSKEIICNVRTKMSAQYYMWHIKILIFKTGNVNV